MTTSTVNTCGGTFYDNGGAGGNYSNNQFIVQTFCSNGGAGTCLQVDFTSFRTRNSSDYLLIFDGPNTSSPYVGAYYGNLGAFQFPILSSSGCLTFAFISNGSGTRYGWSANISCVPCPSAIGASGSTYLHPTTGMDNTYVGACMANACNGTYHDDGGTGSNYALDVNLIYWTFCPDQIGNCLRANFFNFSTEGSYDYLYVLNGPAQNAPQFPGGSIYSGTCTGYAQCMGAGLGPFQSTDSSGCLTFRFNSDFSVTYPGWDVTFDCVPCATGPTGTENYDCDNHIPLCSDQTFGGQSHGPGLTSDGCSGCMLGETYSTWYSVKASTSGTIEMIVRPVTSSDDYDWAVYGPTTACATMGSPVRCSYSAVTDSTGMGYGALDSSENVSGDGWTLPLTVTAGDEFRLMIDNWTAGGDGFTLEWGGTANLDCLTLPIELLNFHGEYKNDVVNLHWTTISEQDNDYFTIERSRDNFNFEAIETVDGAGTSNILLKYASVDRNPLQGKSYYRLKQTDFNGVFTYSDVIFVEVRKEGALDFFNISTNDESVITLEYIYDGVENLEFLINNSMGQVIYNTKIYSAPGLNTYKMTATNLRKGLYFATITDGITIKSKKFLH